MKLVTSSLLTILLSLLSLVALAAPGNLSGSSTMAKIKSKVAAKEYRTAIEELKELVNKDADNADAYNLLGYSNRKLKQYDVAEIYYKKALALDPEHKGALEYLGELYVETNRPDKAKEMLARLDDACYFSCEEYDILKKLIAGEAVDELAEHY